MVVGIYDRREMNWPNIYDILKNLVQRQMGVVRIDHGHPIFLYAKRSDDEPMLRHFILPKHPDFEVLDLIELLDREHFPQHDDVRFKLLKWTISDTLEDIDLKSIPKMYLRYVLTLYFMVAEGFITKFDADIILITIKEAAQDAIPDDYAYPSVVDPGAFQIAFLFLDFFIDLGRSFEVVGLQDLSVRLKTW